MQTCHLFKGSKATSVIGLGSWGIGGVTSGATSYGRLDEQEATDCIWAALESGITFFDTSSVYGSSEQRLGSVLSTVRNNVTIATKGGLPSYTEAPDFSPSGLMRMLEQSLTKLNTDHIDLYQLHNPPSDVFISESLLHRFLDDIKEQGLVKAIGVSVKSPDDIVSLSKSFPFETVQLNINMLDVRALDRGVLDFCELNNINVIARTPLCFGYLSLSLNEDSKFEDRDHRSTWSMAQKRAWISGAQKAQILAQQSDTEDNASPASRAIRFCLLHPAVKAVLTGGMSRKEVEENALAGSQQGLLPQCLEHISQLNKQHSFYVR